MFDEIASYSDETGTNNDANLDIEETPQSEIASGDDSLEDKIVSLLKSNPKGMSAKKISKVLGVSKKEVNKILYKNRNRFTQNLLSWKLK